MKQKSTLCSLLAYGMLLALIPNALPAQVGVYTDKYNNSYTGANLQESVLTPANVNAAHFGKLFSVNVDGQLYAQPLYVPNVSIAGGKHNVVYVATMHNSLYALDADTGVQYWHKTYGTFVTTGDTSQGGGRDISPAAGIGIESTPVIDPNTKRIYFVTQNESSSKTLTEYLNAADITTGADVSGSPALITGTYTTADGTLTFNPYYQNQRPSLTLANGNIYIAWASHGDKQPYQGWIMSYSASNLVQQATYTDVTSGSEGGIWQAGQGLTVDASGNIYASTGNGSFGASTHGIIQTGNSFVKLSSSLKLLDYFTPYNSAALNGGDQDLGASGLLAIPGTSYITGGGKAGVLYLVDTTNMGHFNSSMDNVVQEFQAVLGTGTSHIHGAPIYFNSAANGPLIYVWGENDYLRSFKFTNNRYNTTPLATSSMTAPELNANGAMPGGFMCVSANGNTNGIIWAVTPYNANANQQTVQGIFHAFNADTLDEIWNDQEGAPDDQMGQFAKFVPPIVANGKVYLATFGQPGAPDGSGALNAYGLLPYSDSVQIEAENATLSGGATVAGDHGNFSGSGFVAGYGNTTADTKFNVNVSSAGSYTLSMRYSAGAGTATDTALYVNGVLVKALSCNGTSNWETWAYHNEQITLNSGANTIEIKATTSTNVSINLDYIFVTPASIAASSYNSSNSVGTENSSEGGLDVDNISNGSYTEYNNINLTGTTFFEARVASPNGGSTITIHLDSPTGTVIGTATVPATGGWQNWTNIYCSLLGASGTHNVYLVYTAGMNIESFVFQTSIPQSGVYNLICKTSGMALDNDNGTTNGNPVIQWSQGTGNTNQEWRLGSVGGGYDNLICKTGGLALDNDNGTTNGSTVWQWTPQSGNTNQMWQINNLGGGEFNLICKTGGLALDNEGSTSQGNRVYQWAPTAGNTNQEWYFQFLGY